MIEDRHRAARLHLRAWRRILIVDCAELPGVPPEYLLHEDEAKRLGLREIAGIGMRPAFAGAPALRVRAGLGVAPRRGAAAQSGALRPLTRADLIALRCFGQDDVLREDGSLLKLGETGRVQRGARQPFHFADSKPHAPA